MRELLSLRLSNDTKTAFYPDQENTYGLLPGKVGGTCPFATEADGGCLGYKNKLQTCYVYKTMALRKLVKSVLSKNTQLLQSANNTEKKEILINTFDKFKHTERTRDRKGLLAK